MRETRLSELYEGCLRVSSARSSDHRSLLPSSPRPSPSLRHFSLVLARRTYIRTVKSCRSQFHPGNRRRLFPRECYWVRIRHASPPRRDVSRRGVPPRSLSSSLLLFPARRPFSTTRNRVLTCNVISYVPGAPLLPETRRAPTMRVSRRRSPPTTPRGAAVTRP